MRIHLALVALPLLAGCLSTPPPAPVNWVITCAAPTAFDVRDEKAPKRPVVRLATVEVRAPYNVTRLAVLRSDGSVAFDPCNAFAAQPSALLRGAVEDALEASGCFTDVIGPTSFATAEFSLEVQFTELALDCRAEGRRDARAALTMTLIRDRRVVATARATASVPAADDFSAAFSKAVTDAVKDALEHLDAK